MKPSEIKEFIPGTWYPIETAPMCGKLFLAGRFVDGEDSEYEVGRFNPFTVKGYEPVGGGLFKEVLNVISEFDFNNFHRMTHWTPLPEPPK